MLVFLSIICHYVYFGIFSKKLLEQFFFAFQEFIANYSSIKHVPKSYWCHLYYILHNARWMMYYGLKGRASAYINEPSDTKLFRVSFFVLNTDTITFFSNETLYRYQYVDCLHNISTNLHINV